MLLLSRTRSGSKSLYLPDPFSSIGVQHRPTESLPPMNDFRPCLPASLLCHMPARKISRPTRKDRRSLPPSLCTAFPTWSPQVFVWFFRWTRPRWRSRLGARSHSPSPMFFFFPPNPLG